MPAGQPASALGTLFIFSSFGSARISQGRQEIHLSQSKGEFDFIIKIEQGPRKLISCFTASHVHAMPGGPGAMVGGGQQQQQPWAGRGVWGGGACWRMSEMGVEHWGVGR